MKIIKKIKEIFSEKKKPILFLSKVEFTLEDVVRIEKQTGYVVLLVDDPKNYSMINKEDIPVEVEGDGRAVFFSDGTHEEFEDYQKEQNGLKPWYERIKRM